jgi:hypothetical protein
MLKGEMGQGLASLQQAANAIADSARFFLAHSYEGEGLRDGQLLLPQLHVAAKGHPTLVFVPSLAQARFIIPGNGGIRLDDNRPFIGSAESKGPPASREEARIADFISCRRPQEAR